MNQGVFRSAESDEARSDPRGTQDPWLQAFLSPKAPEVFHGVVQTTDIRHPDPFDVPEIHGPAREMFARLVERSRDRHQSPSGRILLVLGEAGSGKTHLLRALRNDVHDREAGYVAYMQLTSGSSDYVRYALSSVIDSLSWPYLASRGDRSALQRLSDHLLDRPSVIAPTLLETLRSTDERESLRKTVNRVANALVRSEPRLTGIDSDVLPALIYLQCEDNSIRRLVPYLLRCEDLSRSAREDLCGVSPMLGPGDPLRVLAHLGALMALADGGSFVVLMDQLETSAADLATAEVRFRNAMQAAIDLADRIPNAVVVVSCVQDFWAQFRPRLAQSMVDRLTRSPEPIALSASRSGDEVETMVARRLEHLFEAQGLEPKPLAPLHPFDSGDLRDTLSDKSAREVLETCRLARQAASHTGALPRLDGSAGPRGDVVAPSRTGVTTLSTSDALAVLWNDFSSAFRGSAPDFEDGLAELLVTSVRALASLGMKAAAGEFRCDGHRVEVRTQERQRAPDLVFAICNRSTRGGGLNHQLESLARAYGSVRGLVFRSPAFPPSGRKPTVTTERLAALVQQGWRLQAVEEAEWRALTAFLQFHAQHGSDPGFADWVARSPLLVTGTPLAALLEMLGKSRPEAPEITATDAVLAAETPSAGGAPTSYPSGSGSLVLGRTTGVRSVPLDLSLESLKRHTAIVGGSGSGKTTLAMHLIERALLEGVPVLVVDRKGDLVTWARSEAFAPKNDGRDGERDRLRRDVRVRVLTPGDPQGRDVRLAMLPNLEADASDSALDDACRTSVHALAAMLGYKDRGPNAARRAVLHAAVRLLVASRRGHRSELEDLIDFLRSDDPQLIVDIRALDAKLLSKTAGDLQTLLLNNERLLGSAAPELTGAELLGLGNEDSRGTTLTIIAATGLTVPEATSFWVSRLVASLSQFAASRPSDRLQALIFLDEADHYLPAQSTPASKPELENALRRWRSSGLGLVLASQSPADFDYRCRDNIGTWFVGKVKETRAHEKLRPLFESSPQSLSRLPQLPTGRFLRLTGSASTEFDAQNSLVSPVQVAEAEIRALAAMARGDH